MPLFLPRRTVSTFQSGVSQSCSAGWSALEGEEEARKEGRKEERREWPTWAFAAVLRRRASKRKTEGKRTGQVGVTTSLPSPSPTKPPTTLVRDAGKRRGGGRGYERVSAGFLGWLNSFTKACCTRALEGTRKGLEFLPAAVPAERTICLRRRSLAVAHSPLFVRAAAPSKGHKSRPRDTPINPNWREFRCRGWKVQEACCYNIGLTCQTEAYGRKEARAISLAAPAITIY